MRLRSCFRRRIGLECRRVPDGPGKLSWSGHAGRLVHRGVAGGGPRRRLRACAGAAPALRRRLALRGARRLPGLRGGPRPVARPCARAAARCGGVLAAARRGDPRRRGTAARPGDGGRARPGRARPRVRPGRGRRPRRRRPARPGGPDAVEASLGELPAAERRAARLRLALARGWLHRDRGRWTLAHAWADSAARISPAERRGAPWAVPGRARGPAGRLQHLARHRDQGVLPLRVALDPGRRRDGPRRRRERLPLAARHAARGSLVGPLPPRPGPGLRARGRSGGGPPLLHLQLRRPRARPGHLSGAGRRPARRGSREARTPPRLDRLRPPAGGGLALRLGPGDLRQLRGGGGPPAARVAWADRAVDALGVCIRNDDHQEPCRIRRGLLYAEIGADDLALDSRPRRGRPAGAGKAGGISRPPTAGC